MVWRFHRDMNDMGIICVPHQAEVSSVYWGTGCCMLLQSLFEICLEWMLSLDRVVQKHVPGSLQSFIWLCPRPVHWTCSYVPFKESTINLFVYSGRLYGSCFCHHILQVFSECQVLRVFWELSSWVILIETKDKFISGEFISYLTASTNAARLPFFDFPLLWSNPTPWVMSRTWND